MSKHVANRCSRAIVWMFVAIASAARIANAQTAADGFIAVPTVLASPQITTQPSDRTVVAGGAATFSVLATGNPPPSYQWQMSSTNAASWDELSNSPVYAGVTTAMLTVVAAESHSGNLFRAVASNGIGATASNAARLTVRAAPEFLSSPGDQVTIDGGTASFTVIATGAPVPSYRWQVSTNGGTSWTDLANSAVYTGVATTLLVLNGVTPALSGNAYRAIATNSVGSTASIAGTLTVYTAPVITGHPTDRVVVSGSATTFHASASGNPFPVYRWQLLGPSASSWSNLSDGGQYSGSTTAVLTVSGVTAAMSGSRYRIVATNSVTSVSSSTAQLTVHVRAPKSNFIYIGTDRGVLASEDGGDIWSLLSRADVSQLLWNGSQLIVVTTTKGVVAAGALFDGNNH